MDLSSSGSPGWARTGREELRLRQDLNSLTSTPHSSVRLAREDSSGEGRLVWRKDRWGVQIPTSQDEASKQTMIEGKLSRAEDSLVRLSIRIANWLANWLVFSCAHKMMHLLDDVDRERLTPEDISNAVIEILGNEWSELPLDHEGKLKSWKNKRDIPMNKSQFDHILGDSDDQDADY